MNIVLGVAVLLGLVALYYGGRFAIKDAMNMYPRSRRPLHPDYRKQLLRLQADLDQQIAEAEAVVENANMPIPDWVRANEVLKELEQARGDVEGKLRAE
jgi:hypothetical protein